MIGKSYHSNVRNLDTLICPDQVAAFIGYTYGAGTNGKAGAPERRRMRLVRWPKPPAGRTMPAGG